MWFLTFAAALAVGGVCIYFAPEWSAARADLRELEASSVGSRVPEPILFHLSRRLREGGRLTESYAALSQAERSYPRSARVRVARVRALQDLGRWEDSERVLSSWPPALQLGPDGTLLRAWAQLTARDRPEEALRLLQPLLQRSPPAEAHYLAGRCHAALYQAEESLAAFSRAAQKDPGSFRYHREVAQSRLYFGQMREAISALRQAQALAPEDPTTLYLLGACLSLVGRSPAEEVEARRLLERALALQQDDPEIHCQLGQSLQSSGEFERASTHYLQCLSSDPSHWDALYRLAQCRFRLGDERRGETLMAAHSRLRTLVEAPRSSPALTPNLEPLTPGKWRRAAAIYRTAGLEALAAKSIAAADRSDAPAPPTGQKVRL